MSDEQEDMQLSHNFLINIRDTTEVRFWANKLGISGGLLKETVRKVGNSLSSVKEELHLTNLNSTTCKGINKRIAKANRLRPG